MLPKFSVKTHIYKKKNLCCWLYLACTSYHFDIVDSNVDLTSNEQEWTSQSRLNILAMPVPTFCLTSINFQPQTLGMSLLLRLRSVG